MDILAQASVVNIGVAANRHCGESAARRPRQALNPRVEDKINRRFNLRGDDGGGAPPDHGGTTTSDYLINALFVAAVLRQARERRVDLRGLVLRLAAVLFVGHLYVHSLPTAGNDLGLIAVLALVGLSLGLGSGFATHVRLRDAVAVARVGGLAAALLVSGICARMMFAFAIGHGAEPAVRSFSIAHHIGAAAWPAALVTMALCEVLSRLVTVQLRARSLGAGRRSIVQAM
jgi:hypothetical protein